jgi:hypothetical protein
VKEKKIVTNTNSIQRRLVRIDPLFSPTRSVLALLHAVEFVGVELSLKNVAVSDSVRTKIEQVNQIKPANIIERPTYTLESIREALVAIKAELPDSADRDLVRVPETADSMRFVSCVIALANALLGIIRLLSLLPNPKLS